MHKYACTNHKCTHSQWNVHPHVYSSCVRIYAFTTQMSHRNQGHIYNEKRSNVNLEEIEGWNKIREGNFFFSGDMRCFEDSRGAQGVRGGARHIYDCFFPPSFALLAFKTPLVNIFEVNPEAISKSGFYSFWSDRYVVGFLPLSYGLLVFFFFPMRCWFSFSFLLVLILPTVDLSLLRIRIEIMEMTIFKQNKQDAHTPTQAKR